IFAPAAFAASCTRTYTVKEGDWCDTISAAHNVSTYQLSTVNPGIDAVCHNLNPGSTLCLGTDGEDCTTTHVVTSGESCDGIQSVYGINSTMLFTNNPQLHADCSNLYTGEVLCVANAAHVVAAPSATSVTASVIPTTAAPTKAAPTTVAAITSSAAPATTSAPAGDESDDEDMPFCDEL
ncbi:carbohydrate-binding module family 50 protein, partial [Polyporus arcularius HHB13444]